MNALEKYRSSMGQRLAKQRAAANSAFEAGLVVAGAAAGGYIAAQRPDVAGVPTDAALGIVLLTAGVSMKHRKISTLGVGLLAGYASQWGRETGASYPILSVLPGGA